ncbi:hypothetical protein [Paratissierella segnis]|uniref:Aminomethyl transferase family protein n=1 Tax=Paratissierella segnis TaxID=2763679 RepID=A0A926EUV3_9FIRM|nr:hypothetical protein [Paratissierella segnis]MBC8586749.1 aminomethyl transferase family protein [Paratissierella segnis]
MSIEKRYEDVLKIFERPDLEPKISDYLPFYHENILYTTVLKNFLYPYEFTGWKDEQLSWKKTCYIHGGLNPSPLYRFSGKEAEKFLSKYCVNTFSKFPVYSGKHCITCDEEGYITSDGVILKTAEDEFETYWMWSLVIAMKNEEGNYDLEFKDLTNDKFLFQVGGPNSFKVLNSVTDDGLEDVKFMRFINTRIDGKEVRIVRLGMAGSLAYEVHGNISDAKSIYDTIYKAGIEYGIRRLGWHTYMMQHTENGFPQFGDHFMMKLPGSPSNKGNVVGSIGKEATGYANPVELGWKKTIKFDHDFIGRKALEKLVENQTRDMVSLEWNTEGILDVYASRFIEGETYKDFDEVNDMIYKGIGTVLHQDKVVNAQGDLIGVSSGRVYTYYYKKMISLCSLDLEYCQPGTEVIIIWGEPNMIQKKIRATVSRFPYYDENRNQSFDVAIK